MRLHRVVPGMVKSLRRYLLDHWRGRRAILGTGGATDGPWGGLGLGRDSVDVLRAFTEGKPEDAVGQLCRLNSAGQVPFGRDQKTLDSFCLDTQMVSIWMGLKGRYYEAIVSLVGDGTREDLDRLLYTGFAPSVAAVRKALAHRPFGEYAFFRNRIDEWLTITESSAVPHVTKEILFDKLAAYDLTRDEGLFAGLRAVAPLYCLRKMAMPDLGKFQRLVGALGALPHRRLNILDYGCGVADFSLYLRGLGHQVTICDVDGGNLDFAVKRFALRGVDVKTAPASEAQPQPELAGPFDLIIAVEVLEHVRKPFDLVTSLDAALAPDGIVMLGSFPFNATSATGDHLTEAVSQKDGLMQWIQEHWEPVDCAAGVRSPYRRRQQEF